MKIAVTPTVFIAVGGTGTRVLLTLRQRLLERLGTADLPHFRYVFLDTHAAQCAGALQQVPKHAREWATAIPLAPDLNAIEAAIRPTNADDERCARDLGLPEWFDPHYREFLNAAAFDTGVSGKRMLSRLAFLANKGLKRLTDFLETSHDALGTLKASNEPVAGVRPQYLQIKPVNIVHDSIKGNRIRFVVVSSSGGGTGSGSFLEMGYLIRRLQRHGGWTNSPVLGHVILARTGAKTPLGFQANTAALLTELDHYASGANPHYANYLGVQDFAGLGKTLYLPPYDKVFCLTTSQGAKVLSEDPNEALNEVVCRIAEYLVNEAVTTYDDGVPDSKVGPLDDASQGAVGFRQDVTGTLMTYGIACREWPAALVHRDLYAYRLRKVQALWLEIDPGAVAQHLRRLVVKSGIPADVVSTFMEKVELKPVTVARKVDTDELARAILSSTSDADPRRWLEQCRLKAFDTGRLKGTQESLDTVMNDVKTALADSGGLSKGVQDNARRLEVEVPRTIGEALLDVCGQNGPACAERVCSLLTEAVKLEREFVETCLARDWQASYREHPTQLVHCWEYANAQLQMQLLRAKERIYRALETRLAQLRVRLQNFSKYLSQWAQSSDGPRWNDVTASTCVPEGVLERLRRETETLGLFNLSDELRAEVVMPDGTTRRGLLVQLRDLLENGLPERSGGNYTLFAQDGPKTAEGEDDFSYLARVERAIFEKLGMSDSVSPYRQSIATLLQQQGAVPDLFRASEPLIHYRFDDATYRRYAIPRPATLLVKAMNPRQQGFDKFAESQTEEDQTTWWHGLPHEKAKLEFTNQNDWSVAYICERGYIWPRLVNGYDMEAVRNLCQREDLGTPFSDSRIQPQADPVAIQEAKKCLLGTLALGLRSLGRDHEPLLQMTLLGPEQGWKLEYSTRTSVGQPLRAGLVIPIEFAKGVEALARTPEARATILEVARQYVRNNEGEAIDRLLKVKDQLEDQKIQNKDTADLIEPRICGIPIDDSLNTIHAFADDVKVELPKAAHWAVELAEDELIPNSTQRARQAGWHCRKCGTLHGVVAPSWNAKCFACRG